MKPKLTHKIKLAALAVSLAAFAPSLFAQLTIPYADGSDGALNITSDTVIDLSQAVTGIWTNTSGNAGKGIYDPTQWAVVFKYSSVNIASGATLTFSNHPTHAPVVWLVSGNVTINGNLSLDGQSSAAALGQLVESGPGGFRGGVAQYNYNSSSGYGPGGSANIHGLYLNYPYGNTNILPLIGGSGGASGYIGNGFSRDSGGGGGGAILIAASSSITVNGACHANGGSSQAGPVYYSAYTGSGGAVRLVANQIQGSGSILAAGYDVNGDPGRIRLEGNFVTNTLTVYPAMPSVTPVNPPVIFPSATAPTATILSIAGLSAPADPKAIASPTVTANGDVTIATKSAATILVQTMNFPTNGIVTVYIRPLAGSPTVLSASFVSGNSNQAIWQVSASLPIYSPLQNQPGYAVIQARAFVP